MRLLTAMKAVLAPQGTTDAGLGARGVREQTMKRRMQSAAVLLALIAAGPVGASAPRTFVATSGSDANASANCAPASPCRTFAAALAVTAAGGEVIVVDSGGYGPFTITQSVSITVPQGVYAGIAVSSGTGITIQTAGVSVTLRGLTINGTGGSVGIEYDAGTTLSLQGVTIAGFSSAGINYLANASSNLLLVDSVIRDCATGIHSIDAGWIEIVNTKFLGTQTGSAKSMANGLVVGNSQGSGFYRVHVVDSIVNGGVSKGFVLTANSGLADMVLTFERSVIEGTDYAFWSDGNAATSIFTIKNSVVSANTVGMYLASYSFGLLDHAQLVNNGTAIVAGTGFGALQGYVESAGNNTFSGNGSDGLALIALPQM